MNPIRLLAENSEPNIYPHAHAWKPEAPTIKDLAAYDRGRWEAGHVDQRYLLLLSALSIPILASFALGLVKSLETPMPDNSASSHGDSITLSTKEAIVSLDSPENIERLFTPTPEAIVLQPTTISPQEIGNYIDDQPRILDQYLVIPPADLIPMLDGNSISQNSADNLKKMAFVPVSTGGFDYLTQEDGQVGMIPLPNMSTDNGEVLSLDIEKSLNGDWFVYVGTDAKGEELIRYSPKSVACDGECATAIWFGKGENAGTTLIFDMDPQTGEVKGVAQAFYTNMEDKVQFEKFIPSEWSTQITGADAIVFAINNGAEMAYDPDSGTVSFTVEDGEYSKVLWGEVGDYHYVNEFGTYVDIEDENGRVVRYVEIDGNFVKSEKLESPSNAPVYKLGQRVFIERGGLVEWVDKLVVDEKNGDVIITIDNQDCKWDGTAWIEVMTPLQLEWKNLFEKNGYTFSNEKVVSPNGVVVEGLHMKGDTLVMTYAFPELGGDKIDITLTDDGIRFGYNLGLDTIRFNADGTLDMPGLRFDGKQVVQKKVLYNGNETNENLLPIEVVIELIFRDTAAFVEKYGDSVLADDSEMRAASGARARDLIGVYSLSDRTVPFKGMLFQRAVDGVHDNEIYLVDENGKRVVGDNGMPNDIPVLFYAAQELTINQSVITWVRSDKVQVWYMVDGSIGNIQYWNKNNVSAFTVEK